MFLKKKSPNPIKDGYYAYLDEGGKYKSIGHETRSGYGNVLESVTNTINWIIPGSGYGYGFSSVQ
jgi:hypothetical protein